MSRVSGKNGSNMGYQKSSSIESGSFKKAPDIENMLIPESDDDVGSIIQETYPQLLQNLWNPVFFQEKVILAPTHKMLYESSDSICMADADTNFDESIYTTDFLNGICRSLKLAGIRAGMYHGQMSNKAREAFHRSVECTSHSHFFEVLFDLFDLCQDYHWSSNLLRIIYQRNSTTSLML
ncbi:hypothetical protein OROHE_000855 [Orobanche hederae]